MANPVRHIKRLIADDISQREDNLARARIEFNRGLVDKEYLADYEDDARIGRETQAFFAKLTEGQ